jgi:plastocyanin domain-containing protein
MSTVEALVTVLGIGAIVWVNRYFFSHGPAVGASFSTGVQQARIEVHGGYSPSAVRVYAGAPVRLEFHRSETAGCTEEVVLPDFGIRRFLPPHETTPVEFTPAKPGIYEFTCGMGMVRGRLIVEERETKSEE